MLRALLEDITKTITMRRESKMDCAEWFRAHGIFAMPTKDDHPDGWIPVEDKKGNCYFYKKMDINPNEEEQDG